MKMLKDPNHPLSQRLTPVIEIQRPESESRPAETLSNPQAARTTQSDTKTTMGRAGRALGGASPKSVLVTLHVCMCVCVCDSVCICINLSIYIYVCIYIYVPVVPHKAVEEVSKIGSL